jgi:HSP20 family protein
MLSLWRSPLFDATTSLLRALDEGATPARAGTIQEGESAYTLRLEVPGLKADDIEIDVTESSIRLSGERRLSVPEGYTPVHTGRRAYTIRRTLRLGRRVDPDAAEATITDGVLTIVLPWSDAARARRVPVNT